MRYEDRIKYRYEISYKNFYTFQRSIIVNFIVLTNLKAVNN